MVSRSALVAFVGLASVACAAPPSPPAAAPVAVVAAAPVSAPALAPAPAVPAPHDEAPRPPATFELAAIDAYLAKQVSPRGFVGLSVAIVKDGQVVLARGYGQRSLDPALPVRADTPFPIGSITKQLTATSLLLLAERRRLALEDPVAKYYPDLTRAKDIALYDLATKVSGYPDTYPLDFVDQEMHHAVTPDEILARYARRPLDFEPRTRSSYTGTAYVLLGRVIEKVSGKPLGVFFEENLFRPLGMTHATYMPKKRAADAATGYTAFALGPPEVAEPEAEGWDYGAGGVVATASDLATWDLALMNGKVLRPASFARLVSARTLADGQNVDYGCGVAVDWAAGDTVLWHDGEVSGFQSFNAMLPRTKSAVVILSNRDDLDVNDLAQDLIHLLARERREIPKVAGVAARDAARDLFAQLQSGHVDRARLGEDYSAFLTEAKLVSAASRLAPLGPPTDVHVGHMDERGGMERTRVDLTFGAEKIEASMLRSVDGKVQQFLLQRK